MQRSQIATCVLILRFQSFPPSLFSIASLRSLFLSIPQTIEIACFPFRLSLFLSQLLSLLFLLSRFDFDCCFSSVASTPFLDLDSLFRSPQTFASVSKLFKKFSLFLI